VLETGAFPRVSTGVSCRLAVNFQAGVSFHRKALIFTPTRHCFHTPRPKKITTSSRFQQIHCDYYYF
jgi:hypothetical protein